MNCLLGFVVFTSNILGSFNDPFEFDGDYGDELNPIRAYVFEQVVSKEVLASNLTHFQLIQQMQIENPSVEEIQHYHQRLISNALQEDFQHGPTLKELVPPDLIELLLKKQRELEGNGFSQIDLTNLLNYIDCYKNQKVFSLFRHHTSDLLSLDKVLRDQAAREGRSFDLPILSSTTPLKGESALELKTNLLESLFTKDTFSQVEKAKVKFKNTDPLSLTIFTTPAGQVFFYWLYQSLNLHLISQNEAMIAQINKVKHIFANTLGNPTARALLFKGKLITADASVVFTQECDTIVPQQLIENGLFHPVDAQNPADGTFVFLRGDFWKPTYQVIAIDDYEGYEKGRLNVILATTRDTEENFLLASCHGNSTRAEDGRLQITKIVEKFQQLSKRPENTNLQLVIGIDANTKSDEDVKLLRDHLESLGLVATESGPTTVKKRMVTTQHSKAGRFAVDEEDYVITLKPENGGFYQMTHLTVGFQTEKPDPAIALPNCENPSDHYPVGTTLNRIH